MRRLPFALAFAAALTLVLAAAVSARPFANIKPALFTDPVGDSGTASDLTTVTVTNDAKGVYSFDAGFATPLLPTSVVDFYLDTDRTESTGDPQLLGADYLVEDVQADHSFGFYKWDGTQWNYVDTSTIEVTGSADLKDLMVAVDPANLGGSKGFDFIVVSNDGDGSPGHFDDAPSGSGSWEYSYQAPLTLSLVGAKAAWTKESGGVWVLALAARRSDSGALLGSEGTVACAASAGSAKLLPVERAFISAGGGQSSAAVCAFRLPKKLKHKPLHGTITVSFEGSSLGRSFSQHLK